MRIGLDGKPARLGIINAGVGVVDTHKKNEKTLVILDNDTQEQLHIPLSNEQMDKVFLDWFGKPRVEIATPGDMRELVGSNGSKL